MLHNCREEDETQGPPFYLEELSSSSGVAVVSPGGSLEIFVLQFSHAPKVTTHEPLWKSQWHIV